MNKAKLRKYLNIGTFLLWINILIKVINNNGTNLKIPCVLLIVCLLIDNAKDIWDCKDGDK